MGTKKKKMSVKKVHISKASKTSYKKKKKTKTPKSSHKASNMISGSSQGKISKIPRSMSSTTPHVTTINGRMERIGTIKGSIAFLLGNSFPINPGLPGTFPWLSNIARSYELYRFRNLWFEYRTTSGEVISGTNPALGKVIMGTNYDILDAPFSSVLEMENYEGNSNFPPYQRVARHVVDVRGRRMGAVLPYERRYIRSDVVPSTSSVGGSGDPHAYDIGLFQVGVEGMPAINNQVGEIWVGYSVDLIKPKLTDAVDGQYSSTTTLARNDAGSLIWSNETVNMVGNTIKLLNRIGNLFTFECKSAPCQILLNATASRTTGAGNLESDFDINPLTNMTIASTVEGANLVYHNLITNTQTFAQQLYDVSQDVFSIEIYPPNVSAAATFAAMLMLTENKFGKTITPFGVFKPDNTVATLQRKLDEVQKQQQRMMDLNPGKSLSGAYAWNSEEEKLSNPSSTRSGRKIIASS